jgi:hypothetical protein
MRRSLLKIVVAPTMLALAAPAITGCSGGGHSSTASSPTVGSTAVTTVPESQTDYCIALLDAWVPYMAPSLAVNSQQFAEVVGYATPLYFKAFGVALEMDTNTYGVGIAKARSIAAPAVNSACEQLAQQDPGLDFSQYTMPPTG